MLLLIKEGIARYRAWAQENQGRQFSETQEELAKQHGVLVRPASVINREFDIKTNVAVGRSKKEGRGRHYLSDEMIKRYLPQMERISEIYADIFFMEDPLYFLGTVTEGLIQVLDQYPEESHDAERIIQRLHTIAWREIIDQVSEEDLSRYVSEQKEMIEKAETALREKGILSPGIGELAEEADLSQDQIWNVKRIIGRKNFSVFENDQEDLHHLVEEVIPNKTLGSLWDPLSISAFGDQSSLKKLLSEFGLSSEHISAGLMVDKILEKYGNILKESERYVLTRHYRDPDYPGLNVIARELGVTKDRVSQIHSKAIAELRQAVRTQEKPTGFRKELKRISEWFEHSGNIFNEQEQYVFKRRYLDLDSAGLFTIAEELNIGPLEVYSILKEVISKRRQDVGFHVKPIKGREDRKEVLELLARYGARLTERERQTVYPYYRDFVNKKAIGKGLTIGRDTVSAHIKIAVSKMRRWRQEDQERSTGQEKMEDDREETERFLKSLQGMKVLQAVEKIKEYIDNQLYEERSSRGKTILEEFSRIYLRKSLLDQAEKEEIEKALKESGGNNKRAADQLKVTPRTVRNLRKKYNIIMEDVLSNVIVDEEHPVIPLKEVKDSIIKDILGITNNQEEAAEILGITPRTIRNRRDKSSAGPSSPIIPPGADKDGINSITAPRGINFNPATLNPQPRGKTKDGRTSASSGLTIKEQRKIAEAAIRLVVDVHTYDPKYVFMFGRSFLLPKALFKKAWKKVFKKKRMPIIYSFEKLGQEHYLSTTPNDFEAALNDGVDDKTGDKINKIKKNKVVFIDDVARSGSKLMFIQELLTDLGFESFKVGAFVAPQRVYDIFQRLYPGQFIAGELAQDNDLVLRVLRLSKNISGSDPKFYKPFHHKQIQTVLNELTDSIESLDDISINKIKQKASSALKGGIDFNPSNLDLQTQGHGSDFRIPSVDMEKLENMHIEGFTPIIFQIVPITNLPLLLGLNQGEEPQDVSSFDQPRNKFYRKSQEESEEAFEVSAR